ncbi:MAG: DNA-processing protein DprA [Cyclobacteriaceae bacterium]|nr:DNA-processing protein DprA [Cyclobacteriaceae bacterium]
MDQLYIPRVGITLIPGIGNVLAKQLISYCGSAEKVFNTPRNKLLKIPGIGIKIADSIRKSIQLEKAENIVKQCSRSGIRILYFTDQDYPSRLKDLYDSPVILYGKGKGNLNPEKSIGIVGTRRATVYGKSTVEEIIREMKYHNPTIISGLAYGIDYRSHVSALAHDLPTIGVIAGGYRHLYPALHKRTALEMEITGSIISESAPDIIPEAHFFPERNRIIAGMSDVLVVVEAALKGGALITAEYANNYNREVFALPGNIHSRFSEGCNNLIRKHKAHILTSVKDIEYIMNWSREGPPAVQTAQKEIDWSDLSIPEKKIIQIFKNSGNEILIDELSWKSQIPVNQLASHLLNLEFRGYIKALPGKKFRFKE